MVVKNIPHEILAALKSVKDPHTNKSIYEMGMIRNVDVKGNTVHLKLVPPGFGCAFCGMISGMVHDLKNALKKVGYKAEVEVGF